MGKPHRVYVAPHFFEVTYDREFARNTQNAGVCGVDTQTILVDPDLGPTVTRETILHEAMHAMFYQTVLDRDYTSEQQEAIVWSLAPRILAFLRDNPDVAQWLLEEHRE